MKLTGSRARGRNSGRTAAGLVVAVLLLASCGRGSVRGGPAPEVGEATLPPPRQVAKPQQLPDRFPGTVDRLAETLRGLPALLPPEPNRHTPVVMVLFETDEVGRLRPCGPFPVRSGSLSFERERAADRRAPPAYWLVMTDSAGETPLYWSPLESPGTLLLELSPEGKEIPFRRESIVSESPVASLYVPFQAGALVALYPGDGREVSLGREEVLRLGESPSQETARCRGRVP